VRFDNFRACRAGVIGLPPLALTGFGYSRAFFMLRNLSLLFVLIVFTFSAASHARADVVTDWNITLNEAIIATPGKHNPGTSTRAMAMMNAAIYDVFQAISRTHAPFKINLHAPAGTDLNAAVATAAHRVISNTFGEQAVLIDDALELRLGPGPYSAAEQAGINLGEQVAQHYIGLHSSDSLIDPPYDLVPGAGYWRPDPRFSPDQKGWGSDWGMNHVWAIPSADHFDGMVGPPSFTDQRYVDAYNQVKAYGERDSAVRSDEQTEIGLFWAYDRPNNPGEPGVGTPPVLFVQNMIQIAEQIGNSEADNARMFALASVAQADAAIASWHVKYDYDYWRPITAIRAVGADSDGNDDTAQDSNWVYLGAPGHDPNSPDDDFTPPFPAYTSGHATMGGAIFKALELFYETNDFSEADEARGIDAVTEEYSLNSNEYGVDGEPGITRIFRRFTQDPTIDENINGVLDILDIGEENSPEGENGTSRVYLGIHWLFDQQDGVALGNAIADHAASHYFQAVPEPNTIAVAALAMIGFCLRRRRTR
jgi:hypothetical protein